MEFKYPPWHWDEVITFPQIRRQKVSTIQSKIKISGKWFQFWVAGWEEPAGESVELTTQNLSGVKQTDTRSRTSHTCNCTQVCSLFLFHSLYSFIYPSRSISLTVELNWVWAFLGSLFQHAVYTFKWLR